MMQAAAANPGYRLLQYIQRCFVIRLTANLGNQFAVLNVVVFIQYNHCTGCHAGQRTAADGYTVIL